jgi:photosystem II stability/assembly factor-like uncharacterized protein
MTWEDVNTGISAAQIRSLATDNQGHVYVATHRRIHTSNDHGGSFVKSFQSSYGDVTNVAVDSRGNAYAIVMDTILLSTNHGATWGVACATGIWQPPWVLVADPDDNLFTVTRTSAIYRSTNQGRNWACVRPESGTNAAFHLTIAFTPDGTGFLATHESSAPGGRIFRSTDSGFSWVEIGQGLNTNGVQSFCIDPQGVIFLGTNGLGVLRSTDNGTSWAEVNTGLPDRWIRFIVATGNELLLNTASYFSSLSERTYHSTNHGESWFREASGLPEDFVTALAAAPDGHLYAGTQSHGVFRSDRLTDVEVSAQIGDFALYPNFPNPFNSSTAITYSLPRSSHVTLSIYNTLGQSVAILADGYQPAGTFTTVWNAEGCASGVYIVRMVTGATVATRKALLLK